MMSRDVAKMSPRCRGRVAVCCASVAGESRRRRSLSRRRRSLSRRRRGGSPCREVSRGVAGCRGRVAACHAAVAVCRAAVAGGSRSVAPPSRSVAPPSRAGRHPSHRRRGLSRGVVGVAGHLFSVKTATCTWTPIGGGGWKNEGMSLTSPGRAQYRTQRYHCMLRRECCVHVSTSWTLHSSPKTYGERAPKEPNVSDQRGGVYRGCMGLHREYLQGPFLAVTLRAVRALAQHRDESPGRGGVAGVHRML